MAFLKEITKVTAIYMQLSIIMMITIIQHSEARELRPSDHGLDHQSLPPTVAKFPPDMKEFFGASNSATRNTMSPSTGVALPKEKNSSDMHKNKYSSSAATDNNRSITACAGVPSSWGHDDTSRAMFLKWSMVG
ncbi:hypothetical protein NC653_027707 [Populus alba x Populus x berolinensis]|uniref:Uncharacterized protein n=1 Tax=Populus alba x Populus x berolinensis TaxID=444605 RepID=A0AAD6Q6I1_9ROSI|nr:hypothetical protein NC653_027707 [Populus alba x Populus x berolinensis]